MKDIVEVLRATVPKDSGYAETAKRAADIIVTLREWVTRLEKQVRDLEEENNNALDRINE